MTIHIWVGHTDFRRDLLGACIGEAPELLRFVKGAKGKPELAQDPTLHFNVSHSGGLFVVAVTRAGAVGVDVERLREVPDAVRIAERYGLDASRFVEDWVRREAYLKARGVGLSGLRSPVEAGWQVVSFVPEPGFAGAWAIQGGPAGAVLHRWGEDAVVSP